MNITVGITSTALPTSTASGELLAIATLAIQMTIDMSHGMVTRWKKRRMLAKKKLKLSANTSPNGNLTTGTI